MDALEKQARKLVRELLAAARQPELPELPVTAAEQRRMERAAKIAHALLGARRRTLARVARGGTGKRRR